MRSDEWVELSIGKRRVAVSVRDGDNVEFGPGHVELRSLVALGGLEGIVVAGGVMVSSAPSTGAGPSSVTTLSAFQTVLEAAAAGWLGDREIRTDGYIEDEERTSYRQPQTGRCWVFDGVNGYVDCGNVTEIGTTQALSVSAWIKPSSSIAGDIVSKFSATTPLRAFRMLRLAGGQIRVIVCSDGTLAPGTYKQYHTNATTAVGSWTHVGFTFEGATSALKIYINGVEQAVTMDVDDPITGIVQNTDPLILGAYKQGTESWFAGNLFDVQLYTRALTGAEMYALWDTTRLAGRKPRNGVSNANFVRHFKLDEWNAWVSVPPAYCSVSGKHGQAFNGAAPTQVSTVCSYEQEVGYSEWKTSAEIAANGELVTAAGVTDFSHANWIKQSGVTAPASNRLRFQLGAGATGYAFFNAVGFPTNMTIGDACLLEFEARAIGSSGLYLRANVEGNSGINPAFRRSMSTGTAVRFNPETWTRCVVSGEAVSVGSGVDAARPIIRMYSSDHGGGAVDATLEFRNVKIYKGVTLHRQPANTLDPIKDIRGKTLTYSGEGQRLALLASSHAVSMDGVDDLLATAAPYLSAPLSAITVMARIKYSGGSGERGIVCCNNDLPNRSFMLYVDTSNRLTGYISGDGTVARARYVSFGTLNDNLEHHVAMRFNGSEIELFVDGTRRDTTLLYNGTPNQVFAGTAPLRIGRFHTSGALFVGLVYDVRVFASAISDASIEAIALQTSEPADAPLSHWPTAEGSGFMCFDVSGGGRHMTATGTVESAFWGTRQNTYHYNTRKGFRDPTVSGTYRTLDGARQRWKLGGASSLRMGTDKFWVAAWVRPTNLAATRYLIGTWSSDREWLVQLNSSHQPILNLSASGAANQGGMTLTSQPANPGVWSLIFFGVDVTGNPKMVGAVNGTAFQTNTYSQTSVRIGVSEFGIGATPGTPGTEFFGGDIAMAAVGRSSSPLDFSLIRATLFNSGTPLTYAQLPAQLRSQFGLVSWWDCHESDRLLLDSHGGNHLSPVYVARVPSVGAVAADGGYLTHPAGRRHNDAETAIDFTGGVSVQPWMNPYTVPTLYYNGTTLPASFAKRRQAGVNGVILEDRFTLT